MYLNTNGRKMYSKILHADSINWPIYVDGADIDIRRMWINQPSTLQPYHEYHGRRILLASTDEENVAIFTEGPVIAMKIDPVALAEGWPNDT